MADLFRRLAARTRQAVPMVRPRPDAAFRGYPPNGADDWPSIDRELTVTGRADEINVPQRSVAAEPVTEPNVDHPVRRDQARVAPAAPHPAPGRAMTLAEAIRALDPGAPVTVPAPRIAQPLPNSELISLRAQAPIRRDVGHPPDAAPPPVTVTIGQLIVRAAAPAAPPARPAPAESAAKATNVGASGRLSLEDYLRRRRGVG